MSVGSAIGVLLPVIGVLLLVAVVVIFAHAFGLALSIERRERDLVPARQILLSALARQEIADGDIAQLSALSRRRQTRLFVEVALVLAGDDRAFLAQLAQRLGLVETARALCGSGRWWKRLEGARLLNLCDNTATDASALLADSHPLVRVAGAEIVGNHGAPADLELLVPLLRDDAEICRFAAKDVLMRGGRAAEDVVVAHLATDDAVTAESLLLIASSLGSHRFIDVALTRSTDSSAKVRLLAVRLLGAIGNQRATERLVGKLRDVAPAVRWTAAEALAAMSGRPIVGRMPRSPRSRRCLATSTRPCRSDRRRRRT